MEKIKLYQFTPGWGLPNASPFCMKLETYLRMANIPYQPIPGNDPRKAPKGKLPYVEVDGKIIADSTLIIDYLKKTRGNPLDQNLTPQQNAMALAMQALLEDHLYWISVWSRWAEPTGWSHLQQTFFRRVPRFLRNLVSKKIQKHVLQQLNAHGMGRHSTQEIISLGQRDINALAALLGDKPFLLGDQPTSIDACLFAFIGSIWFAPWENLLKAQLEKHPNLLDFYRRMAQRYFPEMAQAPKKEGMPKAA